MTLRSMTGFGMGSAVLASGTLRVEVRALNHRYQDIRLRLPGELGEHGFFVEQLARKHLGRGRFDVSARAEGSLHAAPRLSFERARALYESLTELRDRLAPGSELPITAVLGLPGVLESSGPEPELVRAALEAAFAQALIELDGMRQEEGRTLARELEGRLAHARTLVAALEFNAADLVRHHRERLRERVLKLSSDLTVSVHPERLEQEMALLADKSDITEELVRLGSHFSQMQALLDSAEPVGRRLDFLLQEIGREVNTVGSKSQHAPLAHLVVELKVEVERMREQVQNID